MLFDDLFRNIDEFKLIQFRSIPAPIEINDALGNLDEFGIIYCLCELSDQ